MPASFSDTQPADLSDLRTRNRDKGLEGFQVSHPKELFGLLRSLVERNIALILACPDGNTLSTTIWCVDAERHTLTLSADSRDGKLARLMDCNEVTAVGYLDNVKLQFELDGLVLVNGPGGSALKAELPTLIYRFQRRESFRVRPIGINSPHARLRHPMIPDMTLNLRVLDVSSGGLALFLPDDVPPIGPGVELNAVLIELDHETHFEVRLRLQHITAINPDSLGVRMGCAITHIEPMAARTLQQYIDQTQKRRRAFQLR